MQSLTIGHLAKETGVNLETVRYYERRGLLPKPPRSASGYRLFPAEAARRLDALKNWAFRLERFGNCWRCAFHQEQRAQKSELGQRQRLRT